jgi:hypothetical protein
MRSLIPMTLSKCNESSNDENNMLCELYLFYFFLQVDETIWNPKHGVGDVNIRYYPHLW